MHDVCTARAHNQALVAPHSSISSMSTTTTPGMKSENVVVAVGDGLEVRSHDGGGGCILVATKAFAKGAIVLQESPLITFKAKSPEDFIQKFSTCADEIKDKILDMGHRVFQDIDKGLKEDGAKLANEYDLDADQVVIALDVRHTNAFSFGTNGDASLFWCACKANHSW